MWVGVSGGVSVKVPSMVGGGHESAYQPLYPLLHTLKGVCSGCWWGVRERRMGMEEFMASPTAVMLAWIEGNQDKTGEWGGREHFDAGRMAVCLEVLSSLRTLRSFDSAEYGYALAVGALEGVLERMGVALKAQETYDALSRWRREKARRDAYAAADLDAPSSGASALTARDLLLEDTQPSHPLPRSLDDPSV